MKRHWVYLCQFLAVRTLFIVITLTVLAALITWMEGIKSVYAGEEADALRYVGLKLPSYLSLSLAPGFLLGVALGYHQLSKRNELIALHAQGLSPWQVVWVPAVILGLLFGSLQWTLSHVAVPATRHESDALAAKLGILDPVSQLFSVRRHWVKTAEAFVFVERVGPNQELENVVWVDKQKNQTPSLIAMGATAQIQSIPGVAHKKALVIEEARVLDLQNQPRNQVIAKNCEQDLEALTQGQGLGGDFKACPLIGLREGEAPQTATKMFRREIPDSLSVLMQLTGHPDGFFTGDLRYLLRSAASYGYSLAEYSAALRARTVWPILILLLSLAISLAGVRSKPSTGIVYPFAIM